MKPSSSVILVFRFLPFFLWSCISAEARTSTLYGWRGLAIELHENHVGAFSEKQIEEISRDEKWPFFVKIQVLSLSSRGTSADPTISQSMLADLESKNPEIVAFPENYPQDQRPLRKKPSTPPPSIAPQILATLNGTEKSFSDQTAIPYTYYTYTLRLLSSSNQLSAESKSVSTRRWTPLSAPENLQLKSEKPLTMIAKWGAGTNVENDLIYWDNATCSGKALKLPKSQFYAEKQILDLGTSTVFSIQAINFAGKSGACATWSQKQYPMPPAPSSVAVGWSTSKQPALSWKPIPGASLYRVFRKTGANPSELVGEVAPSPTAKTLTLTDPTSLPYSTTYRYSVAATSIGGTGPEGFASGWITTPKRPCTQTDYEFNSTTEWTQSACQLGSLSRYRYRSSLSKGWCGPKNAFSNGVRPLLSRLWTSSL